MPLEPHDAAAEERVRRLTNEGMLLKLRGSQLEQRATVLEAQKNQLELQVAQLTADMRRVDAPLHLGLARQCRLPRPCQRRLLRVARALLRGELLPMRLLLTWRPRGAVAERVVRRRALGQHDHLPTHAHHVTTT